MDIDTYHQAHTTSAKALCEFDYFAVSIKWGAASINKKINLN